LALLLAESLLVIFKIAASIVENPPFMSNM
jgi:hypothetical protein